MKTERGLAGLLLKTTIDCTQNNLAEAGILQ